MHCDFCCYAAMDARNSSTVYHQIGAMFLKELKALHLTITGGEPFLRKDLVDIISNIIDNSEIAQSKYKGKWFYIKRIQEYIQS